MWNGLGRPADAPPARPPDRPTVRPPAQNPEPHPRSQSQNQNQKNQTAETRNNNTTSAQHTNPSTKQIPTHIPTHQKSRILKRETEPSYRAGGGCRYARSIYRPPDPPWVRSKQIRSNLGVGGSSSAWICSEASSPRWSFHNPMEFLFSCWSCAK